MYQISSEELALRRRRMDVFTATWQAYTDRRDVHQLIEERHEVGKPAFQLVRSFLEDSVDGIALRDGIGAWARGKPIFGFSGPAGAMFLNQLINDGTEHGADDVLRSTLSVPPDTETASSRIDELAGFVEELRDGGQRRSDRKIRVLSVVVLDPAGGRVAADVA